MTYTLFLITLVATFAETPSLIYYSHNPTIMFTSSQSCNDVLQGMEDYLYKGAYEYILTEQPNKTVEQFELICEEYFVAPNGEFLPKNYKYKSIEELEEVERIQIRYTIYDTNEDSA